MIVIVIFSMAVAVHPISRRRSFAQAVQFVVFVAMCNLVRSIFLIKDFFHISAHQFVFVLCGFIDLSHCGQHRHILDLFFYISVNIVGIMDRTFITCRPVRSSGNGCIINYAGHT
ncbi:hypothetical protein D3C86_1557370 [compost metagenome]